MPLFGSPKQVVRATVCGEARFRRFEQTALADVIRTRLDDAPSQIERSTFGAEGQAITLDGSSGGDALGTRIAIGEACSAITPLGLWSRCYSPGGFGRAQVNMAKIGVSPLRGSGDLRGG